MRRFIAVDDCGVRINPMIVEGQVHGGLADGVGMALMQVIAYDQDGTAWGAGSWIICCPPRWNARRGTGRDRHPRPHPPIGAKGVGESATVGSPVAVVNAVVDALAPVRPAAHGDLMTTRPPYQLALSLYGATEDSYDAMTRRRGSFRRFMRGLAAAHEAALPMRINIVVSNRNTHEIPQMKAIADRYGIPSFEYTNISPTIHGGGEVLPSQSREMLRKRKPYTGCNAGITHFHADPHGKASICKIGRDPQVDLIAEGAPGLRRLADAADALITRHGGCSGCTLQKTCGTCMPLANLYRQAQAPLEVFCQHGRR